MSKLNPAIHQDIDAIAGYAGSNSKDLIGNNLLQSLDVVGKVKVIYNLKAALNLTKLIVNGGIRPLDTAVNKADKPGREWSKRKLEPKVGMKIFEVVPEELRETWMSEMLDPNADDVPFAQWVWEQEFATLADEINENYFYSVNRDDAENFNPATVYNVGDYLVYGDLRHIYKVVTATVAGQTPDSHAVKFNKVTAASICDGPGTIIAKAKLNGDLPVANVIATNVINSTNAVAELRKIYMGAPNAMRKKKAKMYVSPEIVEYYRQDYDARYGKGNSIADNTEDQDVIYLKGTGKRVQLEELSGMSGSGMVIYTLQENFLMGTNLLSDIAGIGKLIPTLHGFAAICKFILAFQFADMDVLFVNDKA
jgi:hypothetical protein